MAYGNLNRNLLLFGILLVILGFGSGEYLVAFFGLLVLIPALVSPSKPPTRPTPSPTASAQRPRRVSPPAIMPPAVSLSGQPMQEAKPAPPAPSPSTPVFSPPLFPGPILPTLSLMGAASPPPKETKERAPEARDEVVEAGTILALLKLLLG